MVAKAAVAVDGTVAEGGGQGRGGGYMGSQPSGKGFKGDITAGSYGPEDWATMTYGRRQKVLKHRRDQEPADTDKDKEKTRLSAAASKKKADKVEKEKKKGGKGGQSGAQFGEGVHG